MSEWVRKGKEWLEKKKFGKDSFLILILGGMLLLVIALPTGSGETKKTKSESEQLVTEDGTLVETDVQEVTGEDYAERMERQLTALLRNMDGVGEVQVMVTLEQSQEKLTLKDSVSSNTSSEVQGDTRAEEQLSETTVYVSDSEGNQYPFVISSLSPKILGVAVVAQGGGSSRVQAEITALIQSLFGVEANRIIVTKMKS